MRNLFHANMKRLLKSKAFLIAALAMLAYTGLVSAVCWDHYAAGTGNYTMEAILTAGFGLMGYLPLPTLILAPLLSVYLGTDYSDNTLRNKLIVGHTRVEIYLADLLACVLAAAAMDVCYMLLTGLLCLYPILEMSGGILLRVPAGQMLAWILTGLLARAAYASLVKLLSTLLGNKNAASIAALLLVVVAALVCASAFSEMQFIENALAKGEYVENAEARMTFWQFLVDTMPTGQYLQISRLNTPNLWQMPLLSLAVTAVSTGAGLALFQRKDLK